MFANAFERLRCWGSRWVGWARWSRRLRRIGIAVAIVIVVFGLFGFFGVPPILRYVLTGRVAQRLHRPITVGDIGFNPYSLRLEVDELHIGSRNNSRPFVDVGQFHVKVSWKSLFWLAPIISSLRIDHPGIHIVRTAKNRFNFSDLLQRPGLSGAPKPQKPSKPMRFSVSNIQVNNGDIYFDDHVLNEKHSIQDLRLGVPFIANLSSDIDVFVRPLLQMKIDGSPVQLKGRSKPFGASLESILDLNLHRLDLPRYLGYLPVKQLVKLAHGKFSSLVRLHFINTQSGPHIRLEGEIAFDGIDLRDRSSEELVGIKHASITLKNIEPLAHIIRIGRIYVEALRSRVVLNADGTTNLTAGSGRGQSIPASTSAQVPVQSVAAPPAQAAQQHSPLPSAPARERAAKKVQARNGVKPKVAAVSEPPSAKSAGAPAGPIPAPAGSRALAADTGALPAAQETKAATQPPVTRIPEQSRAEAQTPKLDFSLDSLALEDSSAEFIDRRQAAVASVALSDIRMSLRNLHTLGNAPAPYEVSAKFTGGGAFSAKGNLELAKSQATTDFSLNQLDLAALRAFAEPYLAGELKSGKLSAKASIRTDFAPGHFNVHVEPANLSLDNFNVLAPGGGESPIKLSTLLMTVGQADLATRKALVSEVRADGLKVFVHRDQRGRLNLAELVRSPRASPAAAPSVTGRSSRQRRRRGRRAQRRALRLAKRIEPARQAASPRRGSHWQYQVASLAVEKTQIQIEDDSAGRPVKIAVDPFNLSVKNISNDLRKPISVEFGGTVNHTGVIKVGGTVAANPLKAKLRLNIHRLDLSLVDTYIAKRANAKIASAALTIVGVARVRAKHNKLRARYLGNAVLGRVRVLDRLTGDNFLLWNSLSARRINAGYGAGPPEVHIGALALSNFYARIILNSNGRLNLKDIASGPREAAKSLTRVGTAGAPAPRAPAPAPQLEEAASVRPKPLAVNIALGQFSLHKGHINYTDHFIKPHYTADLTDVGGKIGAFGTASSEPAAVTLEGQLNGSAPINISGSINPLVPMAFVDLTAKANGVELTGFTPYSAKYTGYPITKGTLTVDVHYSLDKRMLTASNHIYIDQLTFGAHVTAPNAANLPVRLAVALLSDRHGVIDLNVPVSGSLNDPQFSIGGVIWGALKNLVTKALTSPFTLIASAFGGGSGQDLSYVEFQPGYAALTPDAQSRLEVIAKALQARPALKLEISGRVDPSVDREGLRHAELAHLIEEQKIEDTGAPKHGVPITVSKDEYDKYLTRAYKAAKFPKPRDFIGLTRSLPPDEMKKLLLAHMDTSNGALKRLADGRANAVLKFLRRKQINPNRLFIVAPKLNAAGIKDKGKTTRVDLSLS